MHGDTEDTPLEIPQRHVDDSEEPDRELVRAVELPEPVPEPLAPVGPFADELVAQDPIDDVGEHRAAPLVVRLADRSVVGRDAEHCCRAGRVRAAEPPPPRKRRGHRGEGYEIDVDCCDAHRGRSSYE